MQQVGKGVSCSVGKLVTACGFLAVLHRPCVLFLFVEVWKTTRRGGMVDLLLSALGSHMVFRVLSLPLCMALPPPPYPSCCIARYLFRLLVTTATIRIGLWALWEGFGSFFFFSQCCLALFSGTSLCDMSARLTFFQFVCAPSTLLCSSSFCMQPKTLKIFAWCSVLSRTPSCKTTLKSSTLPETFRPERYGWWVCAT